MTTPEPSQTKTAQVSDSTAPTSELFHSSAARPRAHWLWVALPVSGLLVVPLAGLIYAATSSFGRGAEPSASGEAAVGLDGELDESLATTPAGARKTTSKVKSTSRSKRSAARAKTSQKPRVDGAALCCAKLEELGKIGQIEVRGTYLAAARVCQAADDEETALKQARGAVGAARAEIPEECKR